MSVSIHKSDCFLICNFTNPEKKITPVIKDIKEALSYLNQGKFVLIKNMTAHLLTLI